jgi:cyclohexyl-isocyanide hydratase
MNIVCILFRNVTQLDLTGPYEVFHRIPGATVQLAAKTLDPVRTEAGFAIVPTTTFAAVRDADFIFVPGGPGVNDAMLDDELLAFLANAQPRWYGSACTGALILGAAGLLRGYKAATHWASMHFLAAFGAIATYERVVVDRNRFTGGGVTAGIDIGLEIARRLRDPRTADEIALAIEYGPMKEEVREAALARLSPMLAERREKVERAAAKLRSSGEA